MFEKFSFFFVDVENVMVLAIKRVEDFDYVILCMYELEGIVIDICVGFFFKIGVFECMNIIEEYL